MYYMLTSHETINFGLDAIPLMLESLPVSTVKMNKGARSDIHDRQIYTENIP